MTAAIFGLLGVLVGGIVNGVVVRQQHLRQDSDAARAAARLLWHDLATSAIAVESVFPTQVIRSEAVPTTRRWEEFEALFARALPIADWLTVQNAVLALQWLEPQSPLTTTRGRDPDTEPEAVETFRRADYDAAMTVLRRIAADGTWPPLRTRLRRRLRRTVSATAGSNS